jgi:MOSC domain-containing protein YiiM
LNGIITHINISRGGIPKLPIAHGVLTPLGIEGDGHAHPQIHGGPEKALLIVTQEGIDELIARGYQLYPGALGENLTTRGLDRRLLRIGQQLRAGPAAWIEITRVRVPCATLDVYDPTLKNEMYDKLVKAGDPSSPRWGLSGFYARVLQPGIIRPQDIIQIAATLA